jgi:acetyl-CoA acetyltransferase
MASPMISKPLNKLSCCPTSDGAGCAILCNEKFMKEHGLEDQAIEIAGMTLKTDTSSTFEDKSCMKLIGYDMARDAAEEVYKQAGVGPSDINVVELHDCFAANELVTYEALKLCK